MEMRFRYYFIEALFLTCVIFVIGFFIGLGIEQHRNNELATSYLDTESEIIDLSAQLDISNLGKFTCTELIERNFEIGNKIYEQASVFEEYDNAAIFTKSQLLREHKKFDALRTLYWINSIKIKDRCGRRVFTTLVYLYDYPAKDIEEISKQKILAKISLEIKENADEKVVLIPLAKNLNISSLNILLSDFDLRNDSSLLIINENKAFFSNETDQIREYMKTNQ